MNTSFYGGKPGVPFIIAKNYNDYYQMIEDFSKGPAFTEVAFGEYILISTENKNNKHNGELYRRGLNYTNELGGAIYTGTIVGPAGKAPMLELSTIAEIEQKEVEAPDEARKASGFLSVENSSLVPGKIDDGTFNDKIEWASITIRDELGQDSTAWVGLKIPYSVIDFGYTKVDAYYAEPLVTREDDEAHPFYEKWNIAVPQGLKGDAIKNFRVIPAAELVEAYGGKEDDIANNRNILVYDYYCYDEKANPEAKTFYLGDYNMISDITLDDDGTFTIAYTHDSSDVYEKKIKWITGVALNPDTGTFKLDFNDSTNYETTLKWINDISLANNGEVTVSYTTGESEKLENSLKWITNTAFSNDGTFTIDYNDGTQDVYTNKVKWVTGVSLSAGGVFTIDFNNGDKSYVTNIIYPTSLAVNANADEASPGNQKLVVTYNNGSTQEIGQPLNYIMRTAVNPENYHLLVLYSSPEVRPADGVTFEGVDGWKDLGAIKDADGVLMGMYLDETKAPNLVGATTSQIITYLNENYPNGAENENKGKIVTVSQESLDIRKFFAFDYDENIWQYVGSFEEGSSNQVITAKKTDSNFEEAINALKGGGICLIIEDE